MQQRRLCQLALVALLALPLPCGAATIATIEGTLSDYDQLGMGVFTLVDPAWVWIQMWSHGGGTASDGTVVAGGNFDPVIWLFRGDTTGPGAGSATFVVSNDDGDCPPANPGLFGCVDSSLGYVPGGQPALVLEPGTYSVVVTVYSKNFQGGPGDPFSNGFNSVPPDLYDNAGPEYFVDVQGIPEPPAGAVTGLSLIGLALMSRRKP